MTYVRKPVRRVVRYTDRSGRVQTKTVMGDIWDLFGGLFSGGSVKTSFNEADLEKLCPPSSAVAEWKGKIDTLKATWNPTGTYTVKEITDIVGKMMNAVNAQHNVVMQARAVYDTTRLKKAEEAYNEIGKRSLAYVEAWQAAQKTGAVINAPDLKDWVIDTMTTITGGMRAAEIAACTQPWWLGALSQFQSYFDIVWNAAKKVVGKVIDLGEKVIDAAAAPFDIIKWLGTYGPWAAVGLGGILVYKHGDKLKLPGFRK